VYFQKLKITFRQLSIVKHKTNLNMSSKNKKSNSSSKTSKSGDKPNYKKSPWTSAKQVTVEEVLSYKTALDEHNADLKKDKKSKEKPAKLLGYETNDQTEGMKEHSVKYYDMTIRNTDGIYVRLLLSDTPYQTSSRVKPGKAEKGKLTALSFATMILATKENQLKEIAQTRVEEQIKKSGEKMEKEDQDKAVRKKLENLQIEYKQWKAWMIIDEAFKELFNDEDIREKIDWFPAKNQEIRGNIQYDRKYSKEAKDDPKYKGKDGTLYTKICEVTNKFVAGGSRPPVMVANDHGVLEPLNYYSVQNWLRYNSVVIGVKRYVACQCNTGMLLHVTYATELNVKRAAKSDKPPAVKDDDLMALNNYDGDFESTEDEIKSSKSNKGNKKDLMDQLKEERSKGSDSEDDSDNDESDTKSDSDSASKSSNNKKSSKKPGKIPVKSDSDDSDSDKDDEPVVKNKKSTKKSQSDNDSDKDDEPVVKNKKSEKSEKSNKKTSKPNKKKADSSDEDSD
jgi:hypothetical protein